MTPTPPSGPRRFASLSRTPTPQGFTVLDAIDTDGRAWWLVLGVGDDAAPDGWTELESLPTYSEMSQHTRDGNPCIVKEIVNPSRYIEFHYNGCVVRQQRLWETLCALSAHQLQQVAWLGDHKGELHVGIHDKRTTELRTLILLRDKWFEQGECVVSIFEGDGLSQPWIGCKPHLPEAEFICSFFQ